MANKSISLIDIRQILRMHHEHHSMRKIENYLGVARKTVSKYISLAQSAAITYPDILARYATKKKENKVAENIRDLIEVFYI